MATRMQQRRGTAAQWTAANPILAAGEIGFETDTSKFKMGNGSSAWSALTYFANAAELAAIIDGAPALLNTLDELALAMGDDPQFLATLNTNIGLKAPINNPTFTGTVSGVTKSMVGLGNVDNTTDALKPVSTATQTELDLKAPLASPALTGVPTAPTATGTTNTTQIATTAFVQEKINGLVDGAPEMLNTLNELAAALADNENFASEITNTLALKASLINLSDHNSSTENVHGIADTSLLVTDAGLAQALTDSIEAHNDLTTNVHGIADTAELATAADVAAAGTAASTALGLHSDATTSVHGIADTSLLVTTADLETALEGAAVDQSTLAGTGIDWNSVDNRFDIDATIATKTYADQAEADAITAAAAAAEVLANAAVVTAGTNADTKISTAVAALTKSSVGLANVDNTSDASKPVSTAQATAIATAKSEAIADATSQVNALLSGAPAALNTLDELAAALGDDANFASTVTTNLAAKAPINAPTFTGLVTVAASGVAFTDGTQTKEGTPSRTPIVQKSANYTLSTLTHRDSLIEVSAAGIITVPTDATLNFPIGTSIDILQTGTGEVKVDPVSVAVTINATPGRTLRTQWSSATLFKRAANTWVLFGDLK
jgi:hypothetical protein